MPQSVCLTTATALSVPSSPTREVERERPGLADQRQLALDAERRRRRWSTAVERNAIVLPLEDLVVDRLLDVRLVVVAERLHAAGALAHAQRAWRPPSARSSSSRRRRRSSVASQAVTWIRRSCPALAAAPVRSVRTASVPLSGPELVRPWLERHARQPYPYTRDPTKETSHGSRTRPPVLDGQADRRQLRRDPDLERVVPCVEGGTVLETTGPDAVKAEILVRMGAMSMTFTGTVEVVEKDAAAHRAVLSVKSKEAGGQGYANATSRSRSPTAAARSTPTRRSPARPRRWARASSPACSTR